MLFSTEAKIDYWGWGGGVMNPQGMTVLPLCTLSPASFSLSGALGQVQLSKEGTQRATGVVVQVILSILLVITEFNFVLFFSILQ